MRFPDSFLDEIRARLPASAVVGRKVKLKKQGREFAGLSPFNAEKTASFFVNDAKGKWFDFSAGKNGDIFTFVMETEGLSFPEAVERLAGEAGVPMPARDAEAEAHEKERATLYDVLELATQFFESALNARTGAAARGYLTGRDIGPDLQRAFRLGYAPADRSALKEHLSGKGITQEQMIAAGLLVAGPDIPVSFDRFRERVIFPITDFRGRIVAFGGRALSADVPAKYLNSPETELFHKGALLYNGANARNAARDEGAVVVVEGYVDVIRMVAAGFANTVAPLGTALTERQLDILWRLADEPILCFDGDKAGLRAAHRAADLALPQLAPGKSLRFARCPPVRTRTTSSAPPAPRRWAPSSPQPARWSIWCGAARPIPASSTRQSAVPRWKRAFPKSHARSATTACGATTNRPLPSGSPPSSRQRSRSAHGATVSGAIARSSAGPLSSRVLPTGRSRSPTACAAASCCPAGRRHLSARWCWS